MSKTIEQLSSAQLAIAKAVYYSCGSMETRDEKELRAWLIQIPGMIKRLEDNNAEISEKTCSDRSCQMDRS